MSNLLDVKLTRKPTENTPSPSSRTLHQDAIHELAGEGSSAREERRKNLARGMMRKYTRDLLSKHSSTAKNYYFQHSALNPLFVKKVPSNIDLSKGLDLNSVVHLAFSIEQEAQSIGAFGVYMNILRHLLLIPHDPTLAMRIWNIIEMFIHRVVVPKEDDGSKDVAKIGVDEFKHAFDTKDNPKSKERHKALDSIAETISILFPKLEAGDNDSDPNFKPPEKKVTERRNSIWKTVQSLDQELKPSPLVVPPAEESGPPPPPLPAGKGPPPPPTKSAIVKPTMKRLNWVKLLPPQIPGSVFAEFPSFDSALQVEQQVLETKFLLKTSSSATPLSQVKVMNLIDTKKSQNLGILLTSIKHSLPTIRESIIACDPEVLSVGNAISLLKLLPSDDEKALLRSYRNDPTVGKPERFLIEIMDITFLRERLEGYVFQREFDHRVTGALTSLELAKAALEEAKRSERLKAFLKFILDVGNTMNRGYTDRNGGNALGFKLSSILKLQDTKTSDNKSTLLHYLVEYMESKDVSILGMDEELEMLKHGSKEHLASIQTEVKDMMEKMNALEFALKTFKPEGPEDKFQDLMEISLHAPGTPDGHCTRSYKSSVKFSINPAPF